MAHAARTAEAIGGASAAPWEELDAVLSASDIVITATGAASADSHQGAHRGDDAAAAQPPAVHHRHRDAPRRRGGGRRNRAGVPLQHRRPPGDRPREPRAARQRSHARRGDRQRGGREVRRLVPFARRHSDRGRAARAVRGDPALRARAARLQAVLAAARGARARRRNHAPDRREAAADTDRTAEVAGQLGGRQHLHRGAEPPVRA